MILDSYEENDSLGVVRWGGSSRAVKHRAAWQKEEVPEGLMGKGMDFLAMDPSFC